MRREYVGEKPGKKYRSGFTLVEVIVVLVILAVLAAIAIPALTGYIDKANRTACQVNMSGVQRLYLASAAYQAYQVEDPQPLLEEAAGEFGGVVSAADTYEAKCGGVCTVVYKEGYGSIESISCSLHGGLEAQSAEGLVYTAGMDAPDKLFTDALSAKGITSFGEIDSTVVVEDGTEIAGNTAKILDYFAEQGVYLQDYNIRSWALRMEGTTPVAWWTDQDITEYEVGDRVRVIRYNSARNTYTAGYMRITEKTRDQGTNVYKVLAGAGSENWQEYTSSQAGAQTADSKQSYEETLSYFNEMEPARSGT
ncbi:MAG: prepilin-type N-terminal cleavage/methylation domain-containing protein [Bacillota bacterium]|nr:prepilin-type N-terminal cleavage/methylation domain-containing protein [Bacillota bacterium]